MLISLLFLQAIKVAIEKKDPSTLKRKRQKEDKDKTPLGFQPFSPTHNSEEEGDSEVSWAYNKLNGFNQSLN